MTTAKTNKPPVVILGGSSNALAVARSLGKHGVDIYLSVLERNCATFTRYAKKVFPIQDKKQVDVVWSDLLLRGNHPELHGSIIFPCNDDGLEFIARHRKELEAHYILDDSETDFVLAMLNKRKTMDMARAAGIPIPLYAAVERREDIAGIDRNIKFPLIVKPQHSHLFQKAFNGEKLFFVNNWEELEARLEQVLSHGLKVILSEMIPGPDTQLASYYTYIDKNGQLLFHFTKRVVRRFPKNNGQGSYHITEWVEEVAEIGKKFFLGVGLRGLGNVEFKQDLRDGQWKIIECNPRFTAAHEQLVRCGMDISLLIYNHLAGRPLPSLNGYKQNVTLWFPRRDYLAYKELKALNELSFWGWMKSIAKPQVLPHFRWSDPMPTLAPFWDSVKNRLSR